MPSIRDMVKAVLAPLRHPALLDVAVRPRRRGQAGTGARKHFLVAPTGGGNIGDEAMVEAFIASVDGPVVLVARSRAAFARQAADERVTVLEMPHLLHRGYFPLNAREAKRLRRAWADAGSVSIIGADVMDGGYIWQNSVTRANIARWAAESGIDSRILGFSWNESPHPKAEVAVRRASDAGVRLYGRDPHSADRLDALLVRPVIRSADVVFTDTAVDDRALAILDGFSTDAPLALVNVSGLVGRIADQTGPTADVVVALVNRGFRVLLLPHVIRDAGDDDEAARAVLDALPGDTRESVRMVDTLLSPAAVRALAREAALVVTGRMHLSIIAMSQGTPAVVVATQGKVSGLMELFGCEDLVVAPRAIAEGQLMRAVETVASDLRGYRARVEANGPRVRESALLNFDGIRTARADRDGARPGERSKTE